MFVHAVYIWLKPGTTAAAREQLGSDCHQYLDKVPNVRHLWVGKPAMTPRSVVDNTYDVGLMVVLEDVAGHDAYQIHPLHLEFVARNGPIFGRVQIYDFQSA
jgi:stress responsive alpha/beta barrel protein